MPPIVSVPSQSGRSAARLATIEKVVDEIYPRLRPYVPNGVRGIVLGGSSADGTQKGDLDLIVISIELVTQRVFLKLVDGTSCDVFIENELSADRAMELGFKDHIVRMLAEGVAIFDDSSGRMESLQQRAREALAKPRPSSSSSALQAICVPADLMRKLERHRNEPVIAQLLYGELLIALLRARLQAAHRWMVPTPMLLVESQKVDPGLAGWVAVASRRPFTPDAVPAIRSRVGSVLKRFTRDEISTQRTPTPVKLRVPAS